MLAGNNCAEPAAIYDCSPKGACRIDYEMLTLAVEIIEEILNERGQNLTPTAKAEAIKLAYQIFEEVDEEKDWARFKKVNALIDADKKQQFHKSAEMVRVYEVKQDVAKPRQL